MSWLRAIAVRGCCVSTGILPIILSVAITTHFQDHSRSNRIVMKLFGVDNRYR